MLKLQAGDIAVIHARVLLVSDDGQWVTLELPWTGRRENTHADAVAEVVREAAVKQRRVVRPPEG